MEYYKPDTEPKSCMNVNVGLKKHLNSLNKVIG